MNGKGKLRLEIVDVYGNRPDGRADIFVNHTTLSDSRVKRDHLTRQRLLFPDLDGTPSGVYRVLIYPMRHRPVSRFIRIREGKTLDEKIMTPIDPNRIIRTDFPHHDALGEDLRRVLQESQAEGLQNLRGPGLYDALDDIRKAGLLNIYAKMKATRFLSGNDAFSFVSSFTRLRGDRFFAVVQKELRDEVKNSIPSHLFHAAPEQAHTPPPGFIQAGSFKTQESYGNLQLTFFSQPETLEFRIDADIDDAQGIGHIFQVVGHTLTGGETHPYDIHEILVGYQQLDPGYRLVV